MVSGMSSEPEEFGVSLSADFVEAAVLVELAGLAESAELVALSGPVGFGTAGESWPPFGN